MSDMLLNSAAIELRSFVNFPFVDNFSACRSYLGMRNGDIPDANIRASSESSSSDYAARAGRLNVYRYWYPVSWDNERWIQADIGYQTYVSGVATQGYGSYWVTSFKVSTFYMTTADDEIFVSENRGIVKVNLKVLL